MKIKTIATIIYFFSCFWLGAVLSLSDIDPFNINFWLIMLIVLVLVFSSNLLTRLERRKKQNENKVK